MNGDFSINRYSSSPFLTGMSAEHKRNQILANNYQFTQRIGESVADYHKRMAEFQEKLQKQIKAENTEILQKKLAGIGSTVGNDLYSLNNANSNISSLMYWKNALEGYDSSLEAQINEMKNKQALIQEKIAQIKKQTNANDKEIRLSYGRTDLSNMKGIDDYDTLKTGSRELIS